MGVSTGYGYDYIGYGTGTGSGDGIGYGTSYDYTGYGTGYGIGYGSGSGDGIGYGTSYDYTGSGIGYGTGYGSGIGTGYEQNAEQRLHFFKLIADRLDAGWVLKEPNSELKREMVEAMGSDRFFSQSKAKIIHYDIDGCGNPRELLKIPIEETRSGYLLAVKVICPTTKRVYYLGVPPDVKTCQEAVASTFGVKPDRYSPDRES